MDFIINAISGMMDGMADALGSWSFTRDLSQDLSVIRPFIEKANVIMPVDTALTVLGLWVALQLVLIAYYWITRTLNLIRGAG